MAPEIEVIGVAAAGAPCMALSLQTGETVETADVNTIADGLATRRPVPEALADLQGRIDDVLLVSDDDLRTGMRLVHRHAGLVIEPSAAAGIAAILADSDRFRGRRVAVILCGSNLTETQISDWLTPDISKPSRKEKHQ
jgi:threonine dehydratase